MSRRQARRRKLLFAELDRLTFGLEQEQVGEHRLDCLHLLVGGDRLQVFTDEDELHDEDGHYAQRAGTATEP